MIRENNIHVEWFEGSHYWEVYYTGEANTERLQLYTSQERFDAFMFAAILILKGKGMFS